jgi:hypothetical protein
MSSAPTEEPNTKSCNFPGTRSHTLATNQKTNEVTIASITAVPTPAPKPASKLAIHHAIAPIVPGIITSNTHTSDPFITASIRPETARAYSHYTGRSLSRLMTRGETPMQTIARALYRLVFTIAAYWLHNGRP